MRVIFIVGDHIISNGRGREEAEQFAGAACTVLSRLEGADHEIHLFYYCYEQEHGGCRGAQAEFAYTFKALKQHQLACNALTEARLKMGQGDIRLRLNWPAEDLVRETQRLLQGKHAALFIFAHGGKGGIELGRIENGYPKELLKSTQLFEGCLPWKQLFTLHMHCHAGQFFTDDIHYTNAKAEKRLGLGISNEAPTQGHVMLAAAEVLAERMANLLPSWTPKWTATKSMISSWSASTSWPTRPMASCPDRRASSTERRTRWCSTWARGDVEPPGPGCVEPRGRRP